MNAWIQSAHGKALCDAGKAVVFVIANHILRPVYCLNASDAVDGKCSESTDLQCKRVCKLSRVSLLGFFLACPMSTQEEMLIIL